MAWGKLVFEFLTVLTKFERELIPEKTKAGFSRSGPGADFRGALCTGKSSDTHGDAQAAKFCKQFVVNSVLVGHSMGGGICLRIAVMAAAGRALTVSKMALLVPAAYATASPLFGPRWPPARWPNSCLGAGHRCGTRQRDTGSSLCRPTLITPEQWTGYAQKLATPAQIEAFAAH